MKTFRQMGSIVLLVMMSGLSSASAQDFNALLDAVEKFDAELKQLVQTEAETRAVEMAEMRNSLKKMQAALAQTSTGTGDNTNWSEQITGLTTAILELRADLAALKSQAGSDEIDQELAMLRAEVAALNQQMQDRPLLASTDPDSYSIAMAAADHESAESSVGGIEWSGFFDVVGSHQNSADDETDFGLGQTEIDLASELSDNIAVEAAVAYNADDGVFELGAAIIGVNLFSSEGSFVSSLDITAGQFDVPFGIDYHVYPSIERKLVTGPTVVDMTHGGWNDIGFQFGIEATHGNFVLYMVNGFEASAEVLDEVETLATGTDVYEEVDTSPAIAIGTRLGVAPFSWFEIGSSFATGWNASNKSEMILVGADLQFSISNFELKGEFIAHSVNRSLTEENNRGYYAQTTYNISERAFVTTRYGSFKPEGVEWIGRSSIGVGYAINDAVGVRVETVLNESSDENQTILQMVAGF